MVLQKLYCNNCTAIMLLHKLYWQKLHYNNYTAKTFYNSCTATIALQKLYCNNYTIAGRIFRAFLSLNMKYNKTKSLYYLLKVCLWCLSSVSPPSRSGGASRLGEEEEGGGGLPLRGPGNPSPLCPVFPPTHTFPLSLSSDTDLCQPGCFTTEWECAS